eukprot:8852994-Heterocapsa_arctica.AAC.1
MISTSALGRTSCAEARSQPVHDDAKLVAVGASFLDHPVEIVPRSYSFSRRRTCSSSAAGAISRVEREVIQLQRVRRREDVPR